MRGHFQLNKLIKNYSPKEIAVAEVKEIYRKIYLEKIKNSFSAESPAFQNHLFFNLLHTDFICLDNSHFSAPLSKIIRKSSTI